MLFFISGFRWVIRRSVGKSILLIFVFFLPACLKSGGDHNPAGGGFSGTPLDKGGTGPQTLTFDDVRPVFASVCQRCHDETSGEAQPNWLDYPTAWKRRDRLRQRLAEKTMPPPGILISDMDRKKLLDWLDSGAKDSPKAVAPSPPPPNPAPPDPNPLPPPPLIPPPVVSPEPPPSSDMAQRIFQGSCIGCHGSLAATLRSPIIYGQPRGYIYNQLQSFKSRNRIDSIMSGAMESVAAALTDDDIMGLSNYLSNISACEIPGTVVNPENGNVLEGEKLSAEKACYRCHDPENERNYPILAGQKTLYLKQQLQAFKSKERKNNLMGIIASDLSEDDMLNLAAYMNSLRSCPE